MSIHYLKWKYVCMCINFIELKLEINFANVIFYYTVEMAIAKLPEKAAAKWLRR